MPQILSLLDKPHFFNLEPAEFDELLAGWGWPKFRADQVRRWVYRKHISAPANMSNLPEYARKELSERVAIASADIKAHQRSSDGTQKLLLAWQDGANAETVMIPDAERRTACVSSQVGCPVGCTFCASGMNGVKGNLTAGQIVEQVFQLNQLLNSREGESQTVSVRSSDFDEIPGRHDPAPSPARLTLITNIVFMGMGEPLANYANVMKAIRILHDPQCFNLGARRITISTVGIPTKMRQLAHENLPVNLAISLHAPNEPLRRQLIPWAEHFALDDILSAARYYFDQTGREVTLEYILLSGVNDRIEHARQLVPICRSLRANVNLIRYNEVEGLPHKRPKAHDVMRFQEILRDAGVNAHVRKSRGRDIDAACGQLRRKQQEKAATL